MSQVISQDSKLSSYHSHLLFSIQHFLSPKPPLYIASYIPKVLETALSSSSTSYMQRSGCPTHRLMTLLQDNPELQAHLNLFVKHHSLEELFTYIYKKPIVALLTSQHLLFQAIEPALSCVSTFLAQGILQGKEHSASSISSLEVSSKNLCTCLISHFLSQ